MLTVKKTKRKARMQDWNEHLLYTLLLVIALFMLSAVTSCTRESASPSDQNPPRTRPLSEPEAKTVRQANGFALRDSRL